MKDQEPTRSCTIKIHTFPKKRSTKFRKKTMNQNLLIFIDPVEASPQYGWKAKQSEIHSFRMTLRE